MLAALFALLAAAPFLGKAVHQDDWAYVATAPALLAEPGEWLAQETVYQGERITAAQGVLHGPVWLALLAIGLEWSDGGVLVPHVFMALLLALLAVSATGLAARAGAPPLATGVALALCPGLLVMAGSVMTDLPMVALFTASLALAARALERDSLAELVGAGLVGLAAALTRYHGVAVVPMLVAAPLCLPSAPRGRGRGARGFVPALVAAGGFALFAWWTRGDWQRAVSVLGEIPEIDRRTCLLAAVCGLGGCGAGWIAGALAAPRRALAALASDRARAVLAALGVALGAGLAAVARSRPSGVNAVLQPLFLVAGAVGLAAALRPFVALVGARAARADGTAGWRERFGTDAWIALWLLGFTFAAWTTVPFGATRYVLPALPPFFLLAGAFAGRHLPRRSAWIAAGVSAVLGLTAATADLRAAEVYRAFAREVAARRVRPTADPLSRGQLWVWGELGFRYYLERVANARILPSDSDEPFPGDHVLKSSLCTATPDDGASGLYAIDPRLHARIESAALEVAADDYPVRVHNPEAGAGFYHGDAGLLPFAFSSAPHDRLQTWRVYPRNPFFAALQEGRARVEGPAEVRVARFEVHPDRPMALAVTMRGEGAVEFPPMAVPVPPEGGRAMLQVAVGESRRLWVEGVPGRGARVRVRVDGEVRSERTIESRARAADRTWLPLGADLTGLAGTDVTVRFEVERLDGADDSGVVFTGFVRPRIVALPE